MGQHIAPVIVVLDKITLRKTSAEALSHAGYIHHRNAEQARGRLNALNPHRGKRRFV